MRPQRERLAGAHCRDRRLRPHAQPILLLTTLFSISAGGGRQRRTSARPPDGRPTDEGSERRPAPCWCPYPTVSKFRSPLSSRQVAQGWQLLAARQRLCPLPAQGSGAEPPPRAQGVHGTGENRGKVRGRSPTLPLLVLSSSSCGSQPPPAATHPLRQRAGGERAGELAPRQRAGARAVSHARLKTALGPQNSSEIGTPRGPALRLPLSQSPPSHGKKHTGMRSPLPRYNFKGLQVTSCPRPSGYPPPGPSHKPFHDPYMETPTTRLVGARRDGNPQYMPLRHGRRGRQVASPAARDCQPGRPDWGTSAAPSS